MTTQRIVLPYNRPPNHVPRRDLVLGAVTAAATQTCDLAFVAKINGAAWTQAQCQQAYAQIKQLLAGQGITV